MLGAELNGSKSAWSVPGGGGGPQKKPFISFLTVRPWSSGSLNRLCLALLCFVPQWPSSPDPHSLPTYDPSLGVTDLKITRS